jgi:hypothetical protein
VISSIAFFWDLADVDLSQDCKFLTLKSLLCCGVCESHAGVHGKKASSPSIPTNGFAEPRTRWTRFLVKRLLLDDSLRTD